MYSPPTFLTVELLKKILDEYKWPGPYTLEDELPAGISMLLPKCELFFREGFESDMNVVFPTVANELDYSVDLTEVLLALRSQGALPDVPTPKPVGPPIAGASLQKVENELRDVCNLLQAYLQPTLEGDFGWLDAVKRFRASNRGSAR
jgi:hypothetical protein